jgi:DNA polymerase-3 subunit delta
MIKKNFEVNKISLNNERFFLIYGVNEGAKKEKINQLHQDIKKENIYSYDEKQILEREENFLENVFSESLFESEKFIKIDRATDKIFRIINIILEKKIEDISIIINCGPLDKKSKIRNLFEKDKNLICMAFYEDTFNVLSNLSSQFLKQNKISISQSDLNLIINRCKGDRESLYNELNKIKVYSLTSKKIDTQTILKLTNTSENYNISELINNCLAKNIKKALNILNENSFGSEDCILFLRSFLFKAKKLAILCHKFEQTKNLELTVNNAKPPIFWKEKEITKEQIKNWSLSDIKELIYQISKYELLVKKNNINSVNLISNFIIEKSSIN